jgi:hypothetical protein
MNATDHAMPTVAGSKLVNRGLISGVGVFENKLDNIGIIEVGHADGVGRLQVLDAFLQDDEGVMAFELGGITPGSQFDQLDITAGGTLAGSLDVSLLASYVPTVGDVFRIIEAGTPAQITGTFDETTLPPGDWHVIYGANFVDLRFVAVPEPGSAIAAAVASGAGLLRRRRKPWAFTSSSAR